MTRKSKSEAKCRATGTPPLTPDGGVPPMAASQHTGFNSFHPDREMGERKQTSWAQTLKYGWPIVTIVVSLLLGVGSNFVSAGWIEVPAKGSDVKAVRAEVEAVKSTVVAIKGAREKDRQQLEDMAGDLREIKGMLLAASAPNSLPAVRKVAKRSAPKTFKLF